MTTTVTMTTRQEAVRRLHERHRQLCQVPGCGDDFVCAFSLALAEAYRDGADSTAVAAPTAAGGPVEFDAEIIQAGDLPTSGSVVTMSWIDPDEAQTYKIMISAPRWMARRFAKSLYERARIWIGFLGPEEGEED